MDFRIYLSYSAISPKAGQPTDDSNPRMKHWLLVAISSIVGPRIIQLLTPDQKQIDLYNTATTWELLLPNPYLYSVAKFTGDKEDFDRVIKHHPMRGGQYSEMYNNCQHFVAMFLVLLKALADETPGKSFTLEPRYISSVGSVMSTDGNFLWNKPNFVLDLARHGVRGLAVANLSAPLAASVVEVPAQGIMGWLGATTTVAAPWAGTAAVAGAVCTVGGLAAVGVAGVFIWKGRSWKESTKIRHPDVYGFPTTTQKE